VTDRYRGTLHLGSTADLAARILQHRQGCGSEFCAELGLIRLVWMTFLPSMQEAMDHEKRVKR